MPRNLISKKPYRGLNVFLLATQGYGSPYWLTFDQAKQLGAHVRQGEKSTLVSFWKFNEYAKENRETGETENKTSALLRYYRVFNIEQCEGLKALHGDDRKPVNPIAECESIANQMPNAPRIEQDSTDHQFGSESYSKEELIAEMGAAMLAGMAGISDATLSNSASYLQAWPTQTARDVLQSSARVPCGEPTSDHDCTGSCRGVCGPSAELRPS
jgi:antirestriction protein ArdC